MPAWRRACGARLGLWSQGKTERERTRAGAPHCFTLALPPTLRSPPTWTQTLPSTSTHRSDQLAATSPALRRDIAPPAGRLAGLALTRLEARPSPAAAEALAAVLAAFPGSARAHAGGGRAAGWAWGALMKSLTGTGDRPPHATALALAGAAARVYALTPRLAPADGAAAAWSGAAQAALAAAGGALDTALAGSGEDGALIQAAAAALDPSAGSPGDGCAGAALTRAAALRRAGGAADALERLLSSGPPGGAPLPGPGIVALVARILGAPREWRGKAGPGAAPGVAPPALRAASLGLLTILLRSAGGPAPLAPTAAAAGRVVTDALAFLGASPGGGGGGGGGNTAPPPWRRHCPGEVAERAALYGAAAAASEACGIAASLRSAPLLLPLVWADAVAWVGEAEADAAEADAPSPAGRKRRKGAGGGADQPPSSNPASRAASRAGGDDRALRFVVATAALDALAALLRSAGPALPARERARADAAATAAAARLETAAGCAPTPASAAAADAARAAALTALTASLLSPCAHRPPHLALGLALLAGAARSGGPAAAAAAKAGLAATEALLHARAVPTAVGAVGGEVPSLVPPGLWTCGAAAAEEEEEEEGDEEERGGGRRAVPAAAAPPPAARAPSPTPPPPPLPAVVAMEAEEAVVVTEAAPAPVLASSPPPPPPPPAPAPAPAPALAPAPAPLHPPAPAASGDSLPSIDSGSDEDDDV